ncbi:MAG: hypothetical protein HFF77_08140 [Oscillospiraceae bacterium]|nr:hypothetical protein [Oscillospiraceae bacterium]
MRWQGWFLRYVRRLTAAGRRQLLWRCGKYRFARPGRSAPRLRCIHASHTVPLATGEAAGLAAMAARLDGVTLRPGETLSCWRALGRRHRKENADQLAGLLLWMSLHTPLTVEECRLSGGEGAPGAACVYPEHDLMLTNDTSQCFQLRLEVRDGALRGQWLCDYEPYVHYQVVDRGPSAFYRQMLNPDGVVLLEEAV